MNELKKILVTGAGGPAGINFIKSLQIVPEKIEIVGSDADPNYLNLSLTNKTYLIPKAKNYDFIPRINEIILKEEINFLHPQPDIEVEVISKRRNEIKCKLFLPSKKTVEICQDKLESAKIWKKKNIPVAETMEIIKDEDVDEAFEKFGSPIWIRATQGAGGKGSTPATNGETARTWINYWKSRGVNWKFIAQEHLPGRNIAFHSLWAKGKIITSMARERVEYIYPHLSPSGIMGTPSVQKTIHDETVNKISTQAVLAIDSEFTGIASVDLKENINGIPNVTEINPGRMFTTSYFFSFASKILKGGYDCNIPYLYIKLAFGEDIPKIPKYNTLPAEVYWIRHIDAPARLVINGRVVGSMYN